MCQGLIANAGYEVANITDSNVTPVILGFTNPPGIAINGNMWVGGGSVSNIPLTVSHSSSWVLGLKHSPLRFRPVPGLLRSCSTEWSVSVLGFCVCFTNCRPSFTGLHRLHQRIWSVMTKYISKIMC